MPTARSRALFIFIMHLVHYMNTVYRKYRLINTWLLYPARSSYSIQSIHTFMVYCIIQCNLCNVHCVVKIDKWAVYNKIGLARMPTQFWILTACSVFVIDNNSIYVMCSKIDNENAKRGRQADSIWFYWMSVRNKRNNFCDMWMRRENRLEMEYLQAYYMQNKMVINNIHCSVEYETKITQTTLLIILYVNKQMTSRISHCN